MVRAAVPISEQVTKQFLRDLKTEEWLSPAKVLQELFEEAEERGRREAMPLITDGGDCVVMEWWRDDRKLTLRVPFIMEMVQRFGPKGASKCSEIDGPDEADLQEAVRWLNDALSTDPPASSEQGADNGR